MVEEMHAGHNKTQQFQDHDPHDIAGKYVAINCSSVWTRCVRWQLPDFVIDTPFFCRETRCLSRAQLVFSPHPVTLSCQQAETVLGAGKFLFCHSWFLNCFHAQALCTLQTVSEAVVVDWRLGLTDWFNHEWWRCDIVQHRLCFSVQSNKWHETLAVFWNQILRQIARHSGPVPSV